VKYGDGTTALCSFECGTELTFDTITVDRHPTPGWAGGKYTRDNIRPACADCNSMDGGVMSQKMRDDRVALELEVQSRKE